MFNRYEILTKHYKETIQSWDWESLKEGAFYSCSADEEGNIIASCFLGTVMNTAPSGKFYSFWCNNQTRSDVVKDQCFFDALDEVAEENGMWVDSGEGDPTDLFLRASVDSLDQVSAFVTPEDEQLARELLGSE